MMPRGVFNVVPVNWRVRALMIQNREYNGDASLRPGVAPTLMLPEASSLWRACTVRSQLVLRCALRKLSANVLMMVSLWLIRIRAMVVVTVSRHVPIVCHSLQKMALCRSVITVRELAENLPVWSTVLLKPCTTARWKNYPGWLLKRERKSSQALPGHPCLFFIRERTVN